MTENTPPSNDADLETSLNLETGKISWPELQRYFARGSVTIVSSGTDLVKVAAALRNDNKELIEKLMNDNSIVRAHDDHAKRWQKNDQLFWAIVVTPWVLVQEIE